MQRALALAEIARPAQWLKNGFVLLPLFFGHALLSPAALSDTLLATFAFCLASSAVYAFNDVRDVERDRRHPAKSTRPLARGALSTRAACTFAAVAAALGLLIGAIVAPAVAATIGAYLVLHLGYSLGLKRIAWLDVVLVAGGFALRIVAGGFAAAVPLTPWILVMGFLLALMLALGKRHGDLVRVDDAAARATSGYRSVAIERVLAVLAGTVLASYVLYTLSPDVMARHGQHALVYSTPWVALGVVRYLVLVFRHAAGGDPSRLAVRDPFLLAATVGWLATLAVILYA